MELPVSVVIFGVVGVLFVVAAWRESRPDRRLRATVFVLVGVLVVCAALIYAAGTESRDSIVVWLPVALVGFALMVAAAVWRRDQIDRD